VGHWIYFDFTLHNIYKYLSPLCLIASGNRGEELKEKDVTFRECGVGLSRAGKFKGIYGVNESTIRYKSNNYGKMWEASRPVRHLISF